MYSQFRLNGDMCLQPMILRLSHFDSVSFISPDGTYILIYVIDIVVHICAIYVFSF